MGWQIRQVMNIERALFPSEAIADLGTVIMWTCSLSPSVLCSLSLSILYRAAQRRALCPCGVLVGGVRERHFHGTNFKPRKLLENAHAAKRQSHRDSPDALPGVGCITLALAGSARVIPMLFG